MEQFVKTGSFLFKFDIKNGYHHVDIWAGHRQFLGFSWTFVGRDRYFVFTVLPFGITSGPFIFTKIMRVLVTHWRERGVNICCFLNDGLATDSQHDVLHDHSDFVKTSLEASGFLTNEDKSEWNPTQDITWLGVHVNTTGGFSIPPSRVTSLIHTLDHIIAQLPYTTTRTLAKF